MKILGYNSSHETSLAQVDYETGHLDFCYEESRFRRNKNYTPQEGDISLAGFHRQVEPPEHLICASYDRRVFKMEWNTDLGLQDGLKTREILEALGSQQSTLEHLTEIRNKYPKYWTNFEYAFEDHDDILHGRIADQFGLDNYNFEYEHHLYHAWCGYHFFKKHFGEVPVICITWDGGGAKPYHHDNLPNYQEVETIYRIEPDVEHPLKQHQRLCNLREAMHNVHTPQTYEDIHLCYTPEFIKDGDAEIEFSSLPSAGQNFSNASAGFGFDKLGRSAGKVMGAASYAPYHHDTGVMPRFSSYAICNLLEEQSLEFSCNIIQKAIDLNPDIEHIVLSGGYSLNCTNNYKYTQRFPNHKFFVDPIPHDGGTAVGAALRLRKCLQEGKDGV